MSISKKILLGVGLVLVAIQFIRPAHNIVRQILPTDISIVVSIPDTVMSLLKNACYDCHSNNTDYPWYSNIQPTGWLMARHINKARNELNFSEFGSYSQRRQLSKLDGIEKSIRNDIMPLKSYKLMHKPAQLSTDEKTLLINWVNQSINSMPTNN